MGLEQHIEELRRAVHPTLVVLPDPGPVRSVALLSGSFDPLTVAHAQLAEWAAALERLFARAGLLYADRTGTEGGVRRVLARRENRRWRDHVLPLEPARRVADVSSRMVRELVRRGEVVDGLLPPEAREAVARA